MIAIWDLPSHEALSELLRSLPIWPWLTRIEVTPLIDHPLWPRGPLRSA